MAPVCAELPEALLAVLREGHPALLLTAGADGFPASAFTWAAALDPLTVRFGADHGSSALANLQRQARASLQILAEEGLLFLVKGPAGPVRPSIESAHPQGMALWEMVVVEVRDQSWPGVRVRPLAYDWAPPQRERMLALERAVIAEMRAAPSPPLSGVVVTGVGSGARFTQLAWARDRLSALLGADPWPGTLNLRVDEPTVLARWRAQRARPGTLLRAADPASCDARAYAVRVGDVRALIVVPEVPGYPEDQIELVAARHLRSELGLSDGDRVDVQRAERP